jgi:hypothetical protein
MNRKKYLVVGFLVLTGAIVESAVAQEKTLANPKTASIDEALSAFLTAFDNLDWQSFRTCFSSTATILHIAAPNIMRIDSPDQFEKARRGVFERIKKSSGRTSPPYMNLNPLDLRVEKLSEDVALDCLPLVVRRVLERRN